jgi:hypothetical protein
MGGIAAVSKKMQNACKKLRVWMSQRKKKKAGKGEPAELDGVLVEEKGEDGRRVSHNGNQIVPTDSKEERRERTRAAVKAYFAGGWETAVKAKAPKSPPTRITEFSGFTAARRNSLTPLTLTPLADATESKADPNPNTLRSGVLPDVVPPRSPPRSPPFTPRCPSPALSLDYEAVHQEFFQEEPALLAAAGAKSQ